MAEVSVYTDVTKTQPATEDISYEEIDGTVVPCIRVAGSMWRQMWENGCSGVYQVLDETSSSVRKTSEVNAEDIELQSAERIFDHIKNNVFGTPASSKPVYRLDALMNDVDMQPVEKLVQPLPPPANAAATPQGNGFEFISI